MTLEGVDRHVEGTYLCTADNGIGESASAAMTITVEYPPEITTEKVSVHRLSDEGDELRLIDRLRIRFIKGYKSRINKDERILTMGNVLIIIDKRTCFIKWGVTRV